MTPRFFRTPADFRAWLHGHHGSETELWIGFYKVKSGKGGMVYREALDEALCYGWIDGLVRRVDEDCYAQRFTPRRRDSTWSLVNIRRVKDLIAQGRMHAAGLAAFEGRDRRKAGLYASEQEQEARLAPSFARQLKANAAARAFFEAQPRGYRRQATWWVMSAKKEETRARRFARLLDDSAAGRRINAATPGRRD